MILGHDAEALDPSVELVEALGQEQDIAAAPHHAVGPAHAASRPA